MFEYTQGCVKVNEINIHYYCTGGDKPPFILLHGASDNGLCWTPVAEILAEQSARTCLIKTPIKHQNQS